MKQVGVQVGRKRSSRVSEVSEPSSAGGPKRKDSLNKAETPAPHISSTIGERLRELRKKSKLSIFELSRSAKVSAGMISQIERGVTNPSFRIMELLRTALQVPLTSLLENDGDTPDGTEKEFVRRGNARPQFPVGQMMKELLSPHGAHDLQMMIIALPAGASSSDVVVGKGEKAGLVISGSILLRVAGREERLGPGDSFQFPSTLAHSVHNEGTEECRFLWIINTVPIKPSL